VIDDAEVRRLALADRRAAVDALYRAHASRVLSNLYLMLRDGEAARDLAQETFVRAFTHPEVFAGDAPLRAWLLRVAARLALNHVREQKRRRAREQGHLPARGPDPLEAVLARHLDAELARGMRELPLTYRQALVLRYHEGLGCDEIARVLEVAPGTVMSHLFRARLVLKRHLTRGDAARPVSLSERRRETRRRTG